MNRLLLILILILSTGCGRKWEQFWGQDTRPETRYIPLTPDHIEFGIGNIEPAQWVDGRFKRARYMSVWACNDNNMCVAIPEDSPETENDLVVYVVRGIDIADGCLLAVYNVRRVYSWATKIRVEVVL